VILKPGTFRVSDYRRPIPAAVERAVRKRYQLDHRPPLAERPYDTDAGDFIPPQHDPQCIFLVERDEHARRTFGRAIGAAKTVTTRGSDIGEVKRARRIRDSERLHKARMAEKSGDLVAAERLLAEIERPARLRRAAGRRKRAIPSRVNPWPKGRKLRPPRSPWRDEGAGS